jgi:hypothetical protein
MAGSIDAIGRIEALGSVRTGLDLALLWLMRLGIVALAVWAAVVRRLLYRHGADQRPLLHWALAVAIGLALVQWVLNWMSLRTVTQSYYQVVSDSGRGVDLNQIVAGVLRMTMAVLIAYGVWAVRGELLGLLRQTGQRAAQPPGAGPPVRIAPVAG